MKPANDKTPRTLADQLAAVLAYRNTPDHKPEPLQSSFTPEPDNDNGVTVKAEKLKGEKLLKVTPSIEAIMREMAGAWVWHPPEMVIKKPGDDPVPLASTGPLKSIGSLQFSNGTQHEKAMRRGVDGAVESFQRRMPRGAMLGATESLTEDAGGQTSAVTISNSKLLETRFPRTDKGEPIPNRPYLPSGKRRRGRSYAAEESRKLIAEAIANTPVLPPVTKCPPGVASGTAQFSDQFIGMKIGSTGKGGMIHWVDLYTAGLEHEQWVAAHESLSEKDRNVLDAAMTAENLADVGQAAGQSKKYATYNGGGRRALIAANDNLAAAIKKYVA